MKFSSGSVPSYDWPLWLDAGLTVFTLLVLGWAACSRRQFVFADRGRAWLAFPSLKWLDQVAETLSDHELIVFNRASLLILFLSGSAFALFSLFQLHGSATSIWDLHIAGETPHHGLLWGHPKGIRSDEITVFTPNTFSQVFSDPPFSSVNHTVGGKQSVLFWTHPVRHFIEFPRFLLWSFHFLPIAAAFSVYWNLKGLVLFVGAYLLLMLLTNSRAWLSAAGALWIYFSSFTQWWFSHCLPEDIGFSALTVVGVLYLLLSRKRLLVIGGAFLLAFALLNFALILYPPFAIPLAWVMGSAGFGILFEKRKLLFNGDSIKVRWVLLAAVLILCFAALVAFVLDTRQTIQMIRQTVYPGHRFNTGGSETPLTLFISFMDSVFTESHVPTIVSNICTGANYCLIGLLALPAFIIVRPRRISLTATDGSIIVCVLVLAAFVFIGFPNWLAGVTLLSMTESKRMKVGIGLAAIFLVVRHFSRTPADRTVNGRDVQAALFLIVLLVVSFIYFETVTSFTLPLRAVFMLFVVNSALVLFAVSGQATQFFAILLTLLISHNFLINPIARGFNAITHKHLYSEVRAIRNSDPKAKWVAFGSPHIANFLKFCGAEVVNGNKFYPVFEYNNVLDPLHRFENVWNSYSHVGFVEVPQQMIASYERLPGPVYRVRISARAPALDKLDVRYCVLTSPPPLDCERAIVKQVIDGRRVYWILKRDLLYHE